MNKQDRFDRFTERARKVLSLAQEEAHRLMHNTIGTEHILLGLIREGQGIAAHVLTHMGADLQGLRNATVQLIERGSFPMLGEIGLSSEAKEAVQTAMDEARRMHHHLVGTEHLLLGLAYTTECRANQILQSVGINLVDLRIRTLQAISQSGSSSIPRRASGTMSSAADPGVQSEQRTQQFDKFTERARRALSLAQEEAQRFQHNYIGTEHLLLGLVSEGEGVAAQVLTRLGVELNAVRESVEFIIGRGDRIILGEIGLTPRSKKVIELAVDEARRLQHHYIGTEHLLLGLVREGEGIAAGVLMSLGVELKHVRGAILKILSQDKRAPTEATPESTAVPSQQWKSRNNFDDYHFTEQVEKVLSYAQQEAFDLQHRYVATEHLLLGLLREEGDGAAQILKSLGADLTRTRAGIETFVGRGERTTLGEVPLTPLARAQIHLAADEADRLEQNPISTEHLLLGLVREGEGIASSILGSLGVSLEMVRSKTLLFLEERKQQ
jgi:ATP-dependent Clp protease ATP-binding subunit ClpA